MNGPVFHNSADIDVPEWLVLAGGTRRKLTLAVRYGLIDHPRLGLTLIDTGYGPLVTAAPGRSLAMRLYARMIGARLRPDGAPEAVLARLGKGTADIRTVILTHYHADHIACLSAFPGARILASGAGYDLMMAMGRLARLHHGFFSELLPADFARRLERFEDRPLLAGPAGLGGHDLAGDGSLLAVPLPGHAIGHHGLLFHGAERPLLYAADVEWIWQALAEGRAPGLPASRVSAEPAASAETRARVLRFAAAGGEVVLCHEPELRHGG